MATLVTRSGKGSPLTHAEVDANFTNLNTDKLELSGGTMTGNLSFGDNDKAIFGAGSDLQIYHDGSHSIIKDAGTGNLQINAGNFNVNNVANTANIIVGNDGGEVNLYYNGSKKLATTNTGVDITGTLTSDGLTVDGSTFAYGQGGASLGWGDTSTLGQLSFDGSANPVVRSATGKALVLQSNGANNRLNIASNGDISFYEDTGTTAKFFWDASAESLGIGTTSPNQSLVVADATGATTVVIDNLRSNVGDVSSIIFRHNAIAGSQIKSEALEDFSVSANRTSDLQFWTRNNGTILEAMRIDSSGNVGIGTSSPNNYSGYTTLTINNGTNGGVIEVSQNSTIKGQFYYDGTQTRLRSNVSTALAFDTNNQEAMRIDSSGNVGIGTSSPSVNLHMKSSGDTQLWLDSSATSVSNRIVSLGQNGGAYKDLRYDAGQHLFRIGTTERMRIDSSGNLLVGTTDALPVQNNDASGIALRADGNAQFSRSGAATARFNRGTSDGEIVSFSKDGSTVGSIGAYQGDMYIGTGDTTLFFHDGIDAILPSGTSGAGSDGQKTLGYSNSRFKDLYLSGDTFVGEPSQIGAGETGVTVRGVGQIRVGRAGTGSATLVSFNNDNGEVGTIRTSGSSTSYNTSSDYRLKENVVDLTGAIDRIKQIPVHRFNFIADPDTTVDGFLAHEVQGIVPEAVTGTKDAMRDEEYEVTPAVLDDDGNVVTEAVMGTRSVPDYQGIDQSKLVPLLVATIKELEARITALEAN